MKKLFAWSKANILFLFSLGLLVFIPLYPKLPLIDIKNTWVYVRAEDFVVVIAIVVWALAVIRNKQILKTPLTVPFFVYWMVGALATLHGLLLIFPDLANLFPNVAFLGFLRRIEYMSLFFISYAGFKDKRFLPYVIAALMVTLASVTLYGIGQKYLGLPAYLTMNEEFAKGIAIRLSPLSRVSSTFAGQYDLAAWLVLITPIAISLIFGFKHWLLRLMLMAVSSLGLLVLFMTVSRISVFGFIVAVGIVLLFQRRKFVLISLPVIAIVAVLVLSLTPSLGERFGSTVKEVNVLVDAKTGNPLGEVRQVSNTYFRDKVVKQDFLESIDRVRVGASSAAALVIPYNHLPPTVSLLVTPIAPTGEDLPSGSGYVNLALARVTQSLGEFYYELKPDEKTGEVVVQTINGRYILKSADAYDLSFTTRFQGEWPHAFAAFKRNILFGSGYGSVSMAVDNSYLRMLGETGLLGLVSYFSVFLIVGISLKRTWKSIDSRVTKSFLVGVIAGFIGLSLNAIFIDVFEASKVAFTLWLLTGVVLGVLHLYKTMTLDLARELKTAATSNFAIIIYLLLSTLVWFTPLMNNFFVGDDFTWFRWAADCPVQSGVGGHCPINLSTIAGYFADADGFFYRPGAKVYFLSMYSFFWLNQTVYHLVSIFLHFVVSALVFLLGKKLWKSTVFAAATAFLFLVLSGATEAVFWISATGFLFTSVFTLSSLLTYIAWSESKKKRYLALTIGFFVLSLCFHELGVVTPLFWMLYQWLYGEPMSLKAMWNTLEYRFLFIPWPLYAAARFFSGSLWWNGDYSYNLLKLPLNVVGNGIGYAMLSFIGPMSDRIYSALRNGMRAQVVLAAVVLLLAVAGTVFVYKKIRMSVSRGDKKLLLFGLLFFVIGTLPFLGLGNISSRYGYLASIGLVFLFVFLLQKLYGFLADNGRAIALGSLSVLVSIFCMLQIVQLQQLHSDWYEAGEKVRRFFVAIDSVYSNSWATDHIEIHLVNVPIRFGSAWVFPVGLPDALWFVFRNPNMKVYNWPTEREAMNAVQYDSKSQRVFVFDDAGQVTEVIKSVNYK